MARFFSHRYQCKPDPSGGTIYGMDDKPDSPEVAERTFMQITDWYKIFDWADVSLFFFVCVCFISQVKNPTNAKCVVKRSAKAPIWSPTAGNTQASNRLDVTFVPRASSVKWICAGTTRASTAWSERAQEQQFKGIVWALWDGIVCCCGQGQQKKRFWATLT